MSLKELMMGLDTEMASKEKSIIFSGDAAEFLSREVTGVTQDSRKVKNGFLFVAIPGQEKDGNDFIADAVKKGAVAVLVGKPSDPLPPVPQVVVENPRKALAELSARYYQDPSLKLRVVGVTGTNGKTSQTYLLESILSEAGRKVAVIGTINTRFGGKTLPASHTTPESCDLQALLAEMVSEGVTDVVMEVSSHALAMDRVRAVHFDAAIFTNLTQDHLDFHHSLEEYFHAKMRLFTEFLPESRKKEKFFVVNMEDFHADELLFCSSEKPVRVGLTGPYEVSCSSFELSETGIFARVKIGSVTLPIRSPLLGRLNLENILLAIGTAWHLGVAPSEIQRGIEKLTLIPGRLERIPNRKGLHIFVDYAHTPDALARVGEDLRKIVRRGRIITVFGCGGDRDRSKRPLMGKQAALFSDLIVLTSDNPRSEKPKSIIEEILPGLDDVGYPRSQVFQVVERGEALEKAFSLAQEGDLVLVAGKGHEDYQIVGAQKKHFSDQEWIQRLMEEGGEKHAV